MWEEAFLAYLSRRLEWAIVIAHRPSSVRPSVVWRKLSYFRHLLWYRWTELNETWQNAISQRPLSSLCFSGRSEKQDGQPCLHLAENFSTSPLKRKNGIKRNLTGRKISMPSTKFVFFEPIGKIRWPPWPLIGWDIFEFSSSKTAERNVTKLDREQDLKVSLPRLYFRADRKIRWPPQPLIGWDIRLLLWNRWTEFNETWQKWSSLCPLPSFCFWADRKNKKAALASDWLRYFPILLWNRWTEFNETWQEARSQRLLPSLCFLGW